MNAPHWLREGTEAHYRDGVYYDHRYRRRRQDVAHYVALAKRSGGPVLELGVGTGRIAFAIAKAGIAVVGIDQMPPMLERARERMQRLPKRAQKLITLEAGDLKTLQLGSRFPLVTAPFNVLMHLYSQADIDGALSTVRSHLEPGGHFALDVLLPDTGALARDPTRIYRSRPIKHPRDGRRYTYAEAFYYDPVSQVQQISTVLEAVDDPTQQHMSQLCHRQFFPQELRAHLHCGGFEVLHHGGDFEGGPLHPLSESQVLVARPRKTGPPGVPRDR